MAPTLDQLRARHAEHVQSSARWDLLTWLVQGGKSMTAERKIQILANPDKRPSDVIKERARLAPYYNKIAPVLSRFLSQLFEKEASYKGSTDPYWQTAFKENAGVLSGDNDGRSDFHSVLREAMLSGLITGKIIIQVDTRVANGAINRAEQETAGELDPYCVVIPRQNLWDWAVDQEGFQFVKIHRYSDSRAAWDQPLSKVHDFTIFERVGTQVLASRYLVKLRPKDLKPGEIDPRPFADLAKVSEQDIFIEPVLERQPIFNAGGKFKFPVVAINIPDYLHLADQLADAQIDYFSQNAALNYALYSTNYAMPVIGGVDSEEDDPFAQGNKAGNGYYLTLKPGQSLTWAERSGGGFAASQSYLEQVKRNIYDTLQQIAMSAADGTAIIARSGESKKEDRRPEQILLETYGSYVRQAGKQILEIASIVRGQVTDWTIEGFEDFLGDGLLEDIADYTGVKESGIPSDTFKRETAKWFARRTGEAFDISQEALKTIESEIDAADFSINPLEVLGNGQKQ